MSRKKPIKIKINDVVEVWPDGTFESKVVKSGNGAVINFYKKFIGSAVVVIVKDKIKDEDVISENIEENKKLAKKYYNNTS